MNDWSGRLRKEEWEVRPISIGAARALIERLHYAKGASNTAICTHGLFERSRPAEPRGVAWWLPPTKVAAHATYPADWRGVLALSRLAIDEGVPKNACTFLLARSMKAIDRKAWPCFVTYADEWRGHTGTIYRACNWEYVGLTNAEAIFVLDGRMIARKAGPKTRTRGEMEELGAEMVGKHAKHKFIHIAPGAGARVKPQMEMVL